MTSLPAIRVGWRDAKPLRCVKKPANSALIGACTATAEQPTRAGGSASFSISYDKNHKMLRNR